MFKRFLIASAATAVGASAIAGPASAAATPQVAADKKQQQAEKRYCLQYDNVVGSRLKGKECRTKAEWARRGIEVDKMLKD